MRRTHRMGVAVLALAMLTSGCYGPFNLTRRLYNWNAEAGSTKWEREFLFLLLAITPVYGLATLGDAIVFNSMEFWTGNNPVEPPSKRSALPQTKRLARGDDEAVLTYIPLSEGAELLVEQFQQGKAVRGFRITRRGGVTVGSDATGKVLLTAQSLANGSVLVRNSSGKQMALYSADQVDRVLGSTRR